MIQQVEIQLPEFPRGAHLITSYVTSKLPLLREKGLLHIFLKHTSPGITLNENADPAVLHDLELGFNYLVPENQKQSVYNRERGQRRLRLGKI